MAAIVLLSQAREQLDMKIRLWQEEVDAFPAGETDLAQIDVVELIKAKDELFRAIAALDAEYKRIMAL